MAEDPDFWAERLVKQITSQKRRVYVCEGGWSPSGYFHIGNARPEIMTPYSVYLKLKEAGFKAKQILFVDDFDPIDKIPAGIPVKKQDEGKFIGVPCVFAPSPFKGYKSWSGYFTSQLTDVIEDFGFELEIQSSFQNYKSGRMNDLIRFSLDNSSQIVETWNRISGSEKPLGFLPVVVTCEGCGKSLFSKTTSWDGKAVEYECKCGFKGRVSPMDGRAKLHWRVHWVANWIVNDVAFESGGKDHFSSGGSVDVARALMQDVFKKKAPFQVPTEFLNLKGAKMSGSLGNVFGLKQWLEIASPDLFRFLFFSYKPNSAIDFNVSDNSFILLNERFERAERIYYSEEMAENEKLSRKQANAYSLSVVGRPSKKRPLRIPYSFAVQLVQFLNPEKQFNELTNLLRQTGHIKQAPSKAQSLELALLFKRARKWVLDYAPEEFRVSFSETLSPEAKAAISSEAKSLLPGLSKAIAGAKTADEIQQAIFNTAKQNNVQPKALFNAVYLALVGKESGPRAGLLIIGLGKGKCVKRLVEAAA
ncbi:MAG: lysine--tRNA ligase [Candidatus Diapherotrites archaeon]|uniref:Lysine--tRNA ligase n=1 Tax=Candidatus Iainarchaeum sp. TaxID=3101447 RepID=A0A938YWH8_9ARCH|nr:lysine--tRNA ligase [Candidatus Diapherotrites archaeon]